MYCGNIRMTDKNIEPEIDLSIKSLAKACRGNVKNLPTFMVHDNNLWPKYRQILPDSLNRIHIRRSTFNNVVATALPVRAGLWLALGVQQFFIDLKPHHLGGSRDMIRDDNMLPAHVVAKTDDAGRSPEDFDYGNSVSEPTGQSVQHDTDAIQSKTGDKARGVEITTLTHGDTEGG